MKVKEFIIEESKFNKGYFVLIAICENGERYVINETASQNGGFGCVPVNKCSDTKDLGYPDIDTNDRSNIL